MPIALHFRDLSRTELCCMQVNTYLNSNIIVNNDYSMYVSKIYFPRKGITCAPKEYSSNVLIKIRIFVCVNLEYINIMHRHVL